MAALLSARLDGETIIVCEHQWDEQEASLRAAAREKRLHAPCCGAPLVLKWGQRKVRHFAHPRRVHCPYDRWAEPESPEHMLGKVRLYEWCRRAFGTQVRILALEYPLSQTLQRPDVYLELHDGTRYAIEYQRTAITPGEWAERHEGYRGQSIHDIWVLGENRLADALPSAAQQARWAAREPHMHFLKLRAFETAAAVPTPFETAWWRGEQQEELWAPLELDARVGRELNPWFTRAALARLRSLAFLDAAHGTLSLYRAMRELPGHTDTHMASVRLQTTLDDPSLRLTPSGFVTPQDEQRLARHQERVSRLMAATGGQVREEPAPYHTTDPIFQPGEQEEEQQRRLQSRAEVPEWRAIVDRFGLKPDNLHFLIGVPIQGDTVILAHRTVWQAFIYYRLVRELSGSLAALAVTRLLGRRFGLQEEMARAARYWLPGQVNAPEEVVGRFLNLLVETGYLRNDMRSEHFRYHAPESPPPALA
ncbi:MAG TPA: competence protein CoiA family protein, partial [Symbiobacteriaceae bacterium]|nr:competence protein CoiA family protein [Symbiobacteriaceae bacterium]